MSMLNPTTEYKYLIRPNGTIRICTKGKVNKNDTDLVVLHGQHLPPGQYRYDFDEEKFVKIPKAERDARHSAAATRVAEAKAARAKKVKDLRKLIKKQSPEMEDLLNRMAELSGIEL